ncbi:MAG: glutathione S-transferase N-terminal domain-containing protein [Myxococcales bacterium]|nr:glutathione S-transferase N-terminal domain-containing protein [Myxococcales bacterium]
MPTLQHPEDLVLYVGTGCGFCQDVRLEAQALGVELEERDAWADADHRAALVEARGRRTVPVLRIHHDDADEWMGESVDIIAYLRERFGTGAPVSPWRRLMAHRGLTWAMWILLLVGGVSPDTWRAALWALALSIGTARATTVAIRQRSVLHAGLAAAFASGTIALPLSALGIADLPWWYVAFGAAAFAMLVTWFRVRAATR